MRLLRDRDECDVQLEGLLVRVDRPCAPAAITHHASAADARAAHDAEIASRIAQGFVEAIDPALDDAARLVYADELQDRGDPVGELIAAQHELVRLRRKDPRARQRIETRIANLLDANHDAWFGALSRHARKPSRKGPAIPALDVRWRLGFAEVIKLRATDIPLAEVYAKLRTLPLSRHALKLTLGSPWDAAIYAPVFAAMLEHGIPSRLRELEVGDDDEHRRPGLRLDGLGAAVSVAPALEALRIIGGHGPLDIASPTLRRLVMHDVTHEDIDALAAADLPSLVELELWARHRLEVPPLRAWFPSLAHLTLGSFDRHGLFAALAPLATQLRSLALPNCGIDDRALAPLFADPAAFAGLKKLDLRRNTISRSMAAALRRELPAARFE